MAGKIDREALRIVCEHLIEHGQGEVALFDPLYMLKFLEECEEEMI